MDKVLRRLYRVQKLREYKYEEDGKGERWERGSYEIMREWMHILSCQLLVARCLGGLIGEKERGSLVYAKSTWEGYSEDKDELKALAASLDSAYSKLPPYNGPRLE
jgi:hypothetical protein